MPGDPDEIDAAPGIKLRQLCEDRLDIGAFRQTAGSSSAARGSREANSSASAMRMASP